MFQSFDTNSQPDQGPGRLAALRDALRKEGLTGFMVPRSDAHQGEYVAPRDERLAWLTGFTGSAGFAIVLPDVAGVFVDGRYRLQVLQQTDQTAFSPVDWPEVKPDDWLKNKLKGREAQIGFDPWLHTVDEVSRLRKSLGDADIALIEVANPLDSIWPDQPAPPVGKASAYPDDLAGRTADQKITQIAQSLTDNDLDACVITLPDSIAWLLNIRGSDIPRIPIAQGFAILHKTRQIDLFMAKGKLTDVTLSASVTLHDPSQFEAALSKLDGRVAMDPASGPVAVHMALQSSDAEVVFDKDPCALPKACKHDAERSAARVAHKRDDAAMVEFLAWLDGATTAMAQGGPQLTEIAVATRLEGFRRETNALRDISFDTICGSGPHGAVVHYRVTHDTNRTLQLGELLLVDSGGQYLDGTTDITRTMAVGEIETEVKACYTRVLKGLIAISQARFPQGVAGRDLDSLARMALWQAGQDYGHGTGHGVGQYLSVHEGPQRLSRLSHEPLQPGMILSNEPGYYREGTFGIRLENLILVQDPTEIPGGDSGREMLGFETLTYVPFDRRLILPDLLTQPERDWLNQYHTETYDRLADEVTDTARSWMAAATALI